MNVILKLFILITLEFLKFAQHFIITLYNELVLINVYFKIPCFNRSFSLVNQFLYVTLYIVNFFK